MMAIRARAIAVVSIVVGLLLALAVAVLPNHAVGGAAVQPLAPAATPIPQVSIVVAAQSIPAYTVISAANVRQLFTTQTVPAKDINAVIIGESWSSIDDLINNLGTIWRRTLRPLGRGQILEAPFLSGMTVPGQGSSLAAALPKGMVAEPIAIAAPNRALNGVIQPNDIVDVIATTHIRDSAGPTIRIHSNTIIQHALVVATNPISGNYTLALPPQDAVKLVHFQGLAADLYLALRSSYSDGGNVKTNSDDTSVWSTPTAP